MRWAKPITSRRSSRKPSKPSRRLWRSGTARKSLLLSTGRNATWSPRRVSTDNGWHTSSFVTTAGRWSKLGAWCWTRSIGRTALSSPSWDSGPLSRWSSSCTRGAPTRRWGGRTGPPATSTGRHCRVRRGDPHRAPRQGSGEDSRPERERCPLHQHCQLRSAVLLSGFGLYRGIRH